MHPRRRGGILAVGVLGILLMWFSDVSIALVGHEVEAVPLRNPDMPLSTSSLAQFSLIPPIGIQSRNPATKYSRPGGLQREVSTFEPTECDWRRYTVRRGDTLTHIFKRRDLPVRNAIRFANHDQSLALRSLVPENIMEFCTNDVDGLLILRYELDNFQILTLRDDLDGLRVNINKVKIATRYRYATGQIKHSLYGSAKRIGINEKLISQLISIFGWDIDFALDLRRGDRFSLAYEELYAGERKVGTGDILAAEFVNNGMVYRAVKHNDEKGNIEYYTPDGYSLRGTFLRTPVKFSRITSGFKGKRFHPMLKKWRAHRGVDYSAPRGTRVLATADGRIGVIGRRGGYGKVIMIRHGGTYSTLYGHLSRFQSGLRTGDTVNQGDVIGYVGSTGRATGPHLHYEFRVNGVHRDPLAFNMPRSGEIPERYREEFLINAQQLIDKLAAHTDTELAEK